MKQTTYEKYSQLVIRAQNSGHPDVKIIEELKLEKCNIRNVLAGKLAQLMFSATPYAAREAKRLAQECCAVIDRIIGELEKKKETV